MEIKNKSWERIREKVRILLASGNFPEILKGTEKLISVLETKQDLPIPKLSHVTIVYDIRGGWGEVSVEVLKNDIFSVCLHNHNLSECLYRKEATIHDVLPKLEKLLISAPKMVDSYFSESK